MSDDSDGQGPGGDGVRPATDVDALTDEVLPALIARLRASRLGELEVSGAGWRVRLRRDAASRRYAPGSSVASEDEVGVESQASVATSPAVGYFTPGPNLAVGASVQAGDPLGSVDVLGIVQEVTAPSDGLVSRVLAESGQAVEYGQALAEVDPLESDFRPDATVVD